MPDAQTSEGAIEDTNTGYLEGVEIPNTGGPSEDPDAQAASSTASEEDAKDKGPKSVLEAIKDVMDPTADKDDGEPSDADAEEEGEDLTVKGQDAAKDETPKTEDGKKPDEGDEKPPPFHEHPRWKALLKERDDLRGQFDEVQHDLNVVRGLRQFATETGLSDEEVGDGLRIMALMKQDPEAALEAMRPHVERLQEVTGDTLPDDLADAVDEGAITPELAAELAKARGQTDIATARAQQAQQQVRTNEGAQISQAVQRWTADWQKSDADASVKLPRVMDRVKVRLAEGYQPRSADEAIAMVKGVVDDVTKEIEALRPKRPARKPITSGGRAPSQAKAAPANMFEVVQQASGM